MASAVCWAIYELVQLHHDHPEEVDTWVNDESQEFTRGSMKYLRIYLAQKEEESELASDMLGGDIDLYTGKRCQSTPAISHSHCAWVMEKLHSPGLGQLKCP